MTSRLNTAALSTKYCRFLFGWRQCEIICPTILSHQPGLSFIRFSSAKIVRKSNNDSILEFSTPNHYMCRYYLLTDTAHLVRSCIIYVGTRTYSDRNGYKFYTQVQNTLFASFSLSLKLLNSDSLSINCRLLYFFSWLYPSIN